MNDKTIGILGLGWLGLPLAEHLQSKGYSVFGTVTSIEKKQELKDSSVNIINWNLQSSILEDLKILFDKAQIIIIAIPSSIFIQHYKESLQQYFQNNNSNQKIIFLSTTGVYPENIGEVNEEYDFSEIDLQNPKVQIELELKKDLGNKSSILRLAGLFGPNRHPITALSKKGMVKDGESPVNLVHLLDVINIISKMIDMNTFPEVLNVCYPEHPKKKEYYTYFANKLNINAPVFEFENKNKIINSKKSINKLGVKYEFGLYLLN